MEEQNLLCKSVQKRLATQWGYTKKKDWVNLSEDRIMRLLSETSGAYWADNAHIIRFVKELSRELKEINNDE